MNRYAFAALLVLITCTVVASSQVTPARARVSSTVMQDLLVTKVPPTYPPMARQARIQGTVILQVQLNKSGDVENIQLVSGHPVLAPAAVEAVKQWKYKPYLLNGEPIAVETTVTVNFTLADKAPDEGVVGDIPGGFPPNEPGGIAPSTATDAPHLAVPQRIRVSSGVAQRLLVTKVPPQYPQEAKDQHIQGLVVMKVIIDKEGNVANVELISGHPLLAPPAIDAVKQWKYKPFLLNQVPLEVNTQVQVNFTLVP
jgi:TonB family protein